MHYLLLHVLHWGSNSPLTLTKKKEAEELRDAAETKAHNQKILTLIAEKQEGKLKEMSIEELEKLLK